MKSYLIQIKRIFVSMVILILANSSSYAKYIDTIDSVSIEKNVRDDYGLVDDSAKSNQTEIMQKAINEVSSLGGGKLIIPKGVYKFASVYMKSNVHLLIEEGTVIKPYWPDSTKTAIFIFDVESKEYKANPQAYIENVSIRGLGGKYIIDYHDRVLNKKEGIRAIVFKMVKNFMVSDMDIKDNYTTYCGMTLTPSKSDDLDVSGWEVSRPTDGTIKNCRIFRASPGYGLVQLHGAQSVYFENLYAVGGVTLRLETGANATHIGVYDITGKKIVNKNGRAALMLGSHSAKNGVVIVDSLLSISSSYCVTVGMGGVKENAPDSTPGYFSSDSKITNIHAIFGTHAQVKNQTILMIPTDYYDSLKLWPDNKFLDGPSIGAVSDNSVTYSVTLKNITMEGFPYNNDKPILTEADERDGDVWKEFDAWKKSHFVDSLDTYRTDKGAVITDYEISDYISNEITSINTTIVQSDKILIYPNPVSDNFYVKIKGFTSTKNLYLYSINGHLIKKLEIGKNSIKELPKGTYYVVLKNNKTEYVKAIYKE